MPRLFVKLPLPGNAQRTAAAVFSALVLGFLLSFPVRTVLRPRAGSVATLDGENREAAPFPDFRAIPPKSWGRAVEKWYDDAMPLRRWLVRRTRSFTFGALRSPFGVYVPGRGHQRFHTGKEWPELEDYLGAFVLPDAKLDRWADLFAGRRAWAEAMGCTFVSAISPTKVQTMPDAPFFWLAPHRGRSLFDQLSAHLAARGETGNVLFLRPALHAPGDGRPLFPAGEDHHPDPEGLYRIYQAIAAAIPGCGVVPWYGGAPPPPVASGAAPGCWADGRTLRVSIPDSAPCPSPFLALAPAGNPGNQSSAAVRRGAGDGLHVVLAHTSYLRYTLSSWDNPSEPVSFPLDSRTGRIDSLLWKFLGEADLDCLTSDSVPAAIVQEINEWHLSQFPVGWGGAMQNAAAFARAAPLDPSAPPPPGTPVCVRAILSNVEVDGQSRMVPGQKAPSGTVRLLQDGATVATMPVRPGIRRPVFFPPVPYGSGDFQISLDNASAVSSSLSLRLPPP